MSVPIEAVPFLLSAALFAALAWYAFGHPQIPGARWLGWVMVSDCWWVLTYAMDLASTDVASTTFWLTVKYLGSAPNSLLWLSFTLEMTGHQRWLRSVWYRALWALPATLVVIVFTNPWHHWFWTDIWVLPGVADSQTSHGPAYSAYLIITAIIGLASLVLFLKHSVTTVPFYRRRNLWLIAALLCPNLGLHIDFSWIWPVFARVDRVLLMLVPASILMSIAVYRYKALDIVPLAQRLVFETINSGVVVVDPEERVVASNQYASQRWPGTTRTGARLREAIPETEGHPLEGGAHWEMGQQADGTWFLVLVSKVASRREGALGHALMFVDISERIAAENARADAVAARSEFLATVSHELRTPLHGVTSLIELTLQTPLNPVQRSHLERAQASSRQLIAIINDVLDQARIEAGQMTFEHTAFDLPAIVEQLRSVHSQAARQNNVDFVVVADDVSAPLLGDPLRLSQVLTNLIGNAIKFSPGGQVVVSVKVAEDADDRIKLTFSVADTGIGISSEGVDALFDPFTQVDSSTTRLFGGTGLGLSISQALVRGMGGGIDVTSQPGQGSTFHFSLWFDVAPADAVVSGEVAPVPDLSGYRILVVEDTPLNAEIVSTLLAETGVTLSTAADGEAALQAARQTRYDAVLMDIHMPKADGLAAARALKATADYAEVPIIAMTASVLREDRDQALRAGMVDFLAKPFDQRQLYEVVRRNLPTVPDKPAGVHRASGVIGEAGEFGIDTKTGLSVAGGSVARYCELLKELAASARLLLDDSQRPEPAAARREPAHALRGTAGLLGAQRLAAAAAAIEGASAVSGDTAMDKVLTGRLQDAIVLVERYLQQAESA